MRDFAAIDFETANAEPTSVCSVGIVIVRNGEVADSFYSLIKPEPDYYSYFCTQVHGLTAEDTCDAPIFPEVWRQVDAKVNGLPLVAHNKAFDENCLKAVFACYQMDYPDYEFYCTLQKSRRVWPSGRHNLDVIAERCGFDLTHHHNALADAEACAAIALKIFDKHQTDPYYWEAQERLLDVMRRAGKAMSAAQLSEQCGMERATVNRLMKELRQEGVIETSKRGYWSPVQGFGVQDSTMPGVILHQKCFDELTRDELYELLRVRSQVFVVEQNCAYQDLDGDDQQSLHLWLTVEGETVALARVCPAGTHMDELSIGRVITTRRGCGYGRAIMQYAIDAAVSHWGAKQIYIEAQQYAQAFYEKVGFKVCSQPFLLDNIPHVNMKWGEE